KAHCHPHFARALPHRAAPVLRFEIDRNGINRLSRSMRQPPLCFTLNRALSILETWHPPANRLPYLASQECTIASNYFDFMRQDARQETHMAAIDEKVKQIIVEQLQVDEA